MKYISEINTPDGSVKSFVYGSQADFSVVVRDGAKSVVQNTAPLDALGVGRQNTMNVLVVQTSKCVRLCDCLTRAYSGVDGELFVDEDKIVVNIEGAVIHGIVRGSGNLTISLDTEYHVLFGVGGSVVMRQGYGGSTVFQNLYDYIGSMCRELRYPIIRYDNICIKNRRYSYKTFLGLKHDAKSDRFWAKMSLDVCK